MIKFFGYLILFALLYYILKFLMGIYYRLKSNDKGVKGSAPQQKKSQIDKDKAVDAHYEEL
ncbi:MAG: hypothetical protein LWX07_04000 [Bacteroidetes bacterium]|nr:hypothetical protein [Bacteroidota bacterium]